MDFSRESLSAVSRSAFFVAVSLMPLAAIGQADDRYCETAQEVVPSGDDYRIWQGGTPETPNNWHTSDNWTSFCFGGCGSVPLPWFLSNIYIDDPAHLSRLRNSDSSICRLYVGDQSEGALEISQSGSLVSKRAILGYRAGGDGQVTVRGSGVSWSVETQPDEALVFEGLFLGLEGRGELVIEDGAEVTAPGVSLALAAGSNGILNLQDAGTRLDAGEALTVGLGGDADLRTENGAVIEVGTFVMSALGTASSTALIQDPGSAWTIDGDLIVADSGIAELQLDQTADVTAGEVVLAESATGEADVLVLRDAYLLSQNELQVGAAGLATLEASLDGRARGQRVIAGVSPGAEGTLRVQTGGSVSAGVDFIVGQQGSGVLEVRSGGTVTVGGALFTSPLDLAEQVGSSGTIQLTGLLTDLPGQIQAGEIRAGSGSAAVVIDHDSTAIYELINGQGNPVVLTGPINLRHLGSGGSRVFDSEHGGNTRVRAGSLELLGGQPGLPTSSVWVGVENADDARLRLADGGILRSGLAVIGQEAGSVGRVVIEGSGTAWDQDGSVEIGRSGTGELVLRSDGRLTAVSLALAIEPGSTGLVEIGNGSLPGLVDVGLIDGGQGEAEIHIDHDQTGWNFANAAGLQPQIQGALDLLHLGPGETLLTGLTLIEGDVRVEQGTLRLSGGLVDASGTLVVGDTAGQSAVLQITGGAGNFDVIRLGRTQSSTGHLLLDNPSGQANLSSDRFMIMGGAGDALIDCLSGCRIESGEGASMGRFASGGASLRLGADGQWLLSDRLVLGEQGEAVLRLDDDAVLSVRPLGEPGTVDLALEAGAFGELLIGESGSAGTLDAGSLVGGAGQADLVFAHAEALHEFVNLNDEPVLLGGSVRLFHNGPGTTRLAGQHDYAGPTAINNGTLIIVDSVVSEVSVNKAGRLESGGRIEASVTSSGRIAPGENGPGRLVIDGDLTLDGFSILEFQLGPPDQGIGPLNDSIQVGGALVLAGHLDISRLPGLEAGRYRLFDYGGTLDDQGLELIGLPPGVDPAQVSIDTSAAGKVDLVLSGSIAPPDVIFQGDFSMP
jgi:T5SS/PEP-CTERM-associated repeat protein/autotransporter-associated beta strand protein